MARSSAVTGGRALSAVWVLLSAACAEPRVDANAAWVEADPAGTHAELHVYRAGERSVWTLPAGIPVADIVVEFDPSGRTLLVGGTEDSVHMHLDQGVLTTLRSPAIEEQQGATQKVAKPTYWFPRNGDAVAQIPHGSMATHRLFAITERGLSEPLDIDPRPVGLARGPWMERPHAAAGASILVYTGVRPSDLRVPWGSAQALRYGPAGIELLGWGDGLRGQAVGSPNGLGNWCPGGVCLDPSGDSLLYMADEPCTIERWRWKGAVSPSDGVERFPVPAPCGSFRAPIMAFGPDQLLMEGTEHFHRVDVEDGTFASLPRIGSGHVLHVADRGRVAVLVSPSGPVLRMGLDEARVLSARIVHCPAFQPSVVSPRGTWVAWSCVSDPFFRSDLSTGATIVRVSAFGLEAFESLPMKVLAIDDLGNALLYSGDIGQLGSPRGLYVLAGDGQLARIDPLEPSPARIRVFGSDDYFAARSLQ